jgi:hypothetical protein
MKRDRRKFNDNELKEAVKHLAFDVYHFRAYVRLCRDRSLWMCAPILVQAVLYALLLHMRILLNFFGARPKHDDIGVGHFLRYPRIKMTFASGLLTPTDRARDAVIPELCRDSESAESG